MSFGIRAWSAGGALRLDTTDPITRLLHEQFLPANESSSVTVSGFDPNKGAAFAVCEDSAYDVGPHEISVSGETISWAPAGDAPGDSRLIVLMYG